MHMDAITLAQTSQGTASARDKVVGVLMLDAAVMVLMYAPLQRCAVKNVDTGYTEWPFSLKGLRRNGHPTGIATCSLRKIQVTTHSHASEGPSCRPIFEHPTARWPTYADRQ